MSEENLEKLSVMADKMLELTPSNEIHSASTSMQSNSSSEHRISELFKKLTILKNKLEKITARQARSVSKPRNRYNPNGKFCYYHYRFGENCKPEKCNDPCAWKKGNSKQQPN